MTIEILGLGDLRKSFAGLRDEMKMKTALRMVASAGGVLRTEAKRIAQSRGLRKTGAMIRNIAIKRERRAPAGTTQYHLGVKHGRDLGKRAIKYLAIGSRGKRRGRVVTRYKNDPYYWFMVNFGTKYIKPGYRFMEDALENKRAEAIAAMEKRLQQDIEKANRLAAK